MTIKQNNDNYAICIFGEEITNKNCNKLDIHIKWIKSKDYIEMFLLCNDFC